MLAQLGVKPPDFAGKAAHALCIIDAIVLRGCDQLDIGSVKGCGRQRQHDLNEVQVRFFCETEKRLVVECLAGDPGIGVTAAGDGGRHGIAHDEGFGAFGLLTCELTGFILDQHGVLDQCQRARIAIGQTVERLGKSQMQSLVLNPQLDLLAKSCLLSRSNLLSIRLRFRKVEIIEQKLTPGRRLKRCRLIL